MTIGLIQFITPVLQLLVSVTLLAEHLTTERWVGFTIVWIALGWDSVDSLDSARRRRRPVEECESLEPAEPV